MSSITECPVCATVFRVSKEQLKSARGKVRCGACLATFKAADHWVFPKLPDSHKVLLQGSPHIDDAPVLENPLDINSDALMRELHEIFDNYDPDDPEFDDILDELLEDAQRPLPSFDLPFPTTEYDEVKRPSKIRNWQGWPHAVIGLGLLGLVTQFVMLRFDHLASQAATRPLTTALCAIANCELPNYRNIDELSLGEILVRNAPDHAGVLLLTTDIDNRSHFAQPYPFLEITFSNQDGRSASRTFTPSQYLGNETLARRNLPGNKAARIHLEIIDPGVDYESFQAKIHF